ncbi:MAG: TonB family protein [Sphingomonadales bacterium]|jgi:protein TonB
MLIRYGSSIIMASFVTFGLFFLMQFLVAMGNAEIKKDDGLKIMDMVRVNREEDVQTRDRKVEKPPEVEAPPPDLNIPQTQSLKPGANSIAFGGASVDATANISGNAFGGITDGEYLPIVKVAPIYPRRAQERGISGEVLLEFTVTSLGTVEDVVVIEATPPGYFERSAINAAKKFKYKPKVVNGDPMAVAGVRNLITFQIEEG